MRPSFRLLRRRLSRGERIGIAAGAVVLLALTCAFGPIVRARVASEAARRHLTIDVGGVRPGWFAVRLVDVRIKPDGVPGVSVRLDSVKVGVGPLLGLRAVQLTGGEIALEGTPESLTDSFNAWRARASENGATPGSTGARYPIDAEGLTVRWTDPEGTSVEALGVGFSREAEATTVRANLVRLEHRDLVVSMTGGDLELQAAGQLRHAGASSVEVLWGKPAPEGGGRSDVGPVGSTPPPPADIDVVPGAKKGKKAKETKGNAPVLAATPAADASAPLLPLPDLHALRRHVAVAANALAAHFQDGASVGLRGVSFKWRRDGLPLSVGPGELAAERHGARFDVTFSTGNGAEPSDGSPAQSPLKVGATIPLGPEEVSGTLEGGPVSLALLGMKEGAAGFVDVDRTTVAGKARLVLNGAGEALSFDGDVQIRGLALNQPRLAPETVRGLDVGVRLNASLHDTGELRLDDLNAKVGAFQVNARGLLDQAPDHVSASLRFDVPRAPCQSLFDSIPPGLLPTLRGTRFSGAFGARGRVEFDSRSLDDMVLDYDVDDQCKFTQVPDLLARDRFKQPFTHRIYLPDGATAEETTGPGSGKWTEIGAISPYMEIAVLTTEDGGFRRHHGFNHAAIRSSIIANLKARRFVRGASTITMQLAKNLFLTRDKMLSRKLEEVILADYLEQAFTKEEMMELYLNVIEFGPNVYGIGAASQHYFGRDPIDLNLAECLFLSSMLPAPIRYHYVKERGELPESWQRSIHNLMNIAKKVGLISEEELELGHTEEVVFSAEGVRPVPRRNPLPSRDMSGVDWKQAD